MMRAITGLTIAFGIATKFFELFAFEMHDHDWVSLINLTATVILGAFAILCTASFYLRQP